VMLMNARREGMLNQSSLRKDLTVTPLRINDSFSYQRPTRDVLATSKAVCLARQGQCAPYYYTYWMVCPPVLGEPALLRLAYTEAREPATNAFRGSELPIIHLQEAL
jgi:hypothetical protein